MPLSVVINLHRIRWSTELSWVKLGKYAKNWIKSGRFKWCTILWIGARWWVITWLENHEFLPAIRQLEYKYRRPLLCQPFSISILNIYISRAPTTHFIAPTMCWSKKKKKKKLNWKKKNYNENQISKFARSYSRSGLNESLTCELGHFSANS